MTSGNLTRRSCIRLLALAAAPATLAGAGFHLVRVRCHDGAAKCRLLESVASFGRDPSLAAVFEAVAAAHLPELLLVGRAGTLRRLAESAGPGCEAGAPTELSWLDRRICRRRGDVFLEVCRYPERLELRVFRSLEQRASRWYTNQCSNGCPIGISLYRSLPVLENVS